MKEETKARFIDAAKGFLDAIESVPADKFNDKPFERSWSAAQAAQHIFLAIQGVPKLFEMRTEADQRDPAKNIVELRNIFTNYDTKLDSPAFILPEDKNYDKEEMVNALREKFDAIKKSIEENDLNGVVADVPFPGMGTMSRYEWIWFTIFHTDRHAKQIREIGRLVTA